MRDKGRQHLRRRLLQPEWRVVRLTSQYASPTYKQNLNAGAPGTYRGRENIQITGYTFYALAGLDMLQLAELIAVNSSFFIFLC